MPGWLTDLPDLGGAKSLTKSKPKAKKSQHGFSKELDSLLLGEESSPVSIKKKGGKQNDLKKNSIFEALPTETPKVELTESITNNQKFTPLEDPQSSIDKEIATLDKVPAFVMNKVNCPLLGGLHKAASFPDIPAKVLTPLRKPAFLLGKEDPLLSLVKAKSDITQSPSMVGSTNPLSPLPLSLKTLAPLCQELRPAAKLSPIREPKHELGLIKSPSSKNVPPSENPIGQSLKKNKSTILPGRVRPSSSIKKKQDKKERYEAARVECAGGDSCSTDDDIAKLNSVLDESVDGVDTNMARPEKDASNHSIIGGQLSYDSEASLDGAPTLKSCGRSILDSPPVGNNISYSDSSEDDTKIEDVFELQKRGNGFINFTIKEILDERPSGRKSECKDADADKKASIRSSKEESETKICDKKEKDEDSLWSPRSTGRRTQFLDDDFNSASISFSYSEPQSSLPQQNIHPVPEEVTEAMSDVEDIPEDIGEEIEFAGEDENADEIVITNQDPACDKKDNYKESDVKEDTPVVECETTEEQDISEVGELGFYNLARSILTCNDELPKPEVPDTGRLVSLLREVAGGHNIITKEPVNEKVESSQDDFYVKYDESQYDETESSYTTKQNKNESEAKNCTRDETIFNDAATEEDVSVHSALDDAFEKDERDCVLSYEESEIRDSPRSSSSCSSQKSGKDIDSPRSTHSRSSSHSSYTPRSSYSSNVSGLRSCSSIEIFLNELKSKVRYVENEKLVPENEVNPEKEQEFNTDAESQNSHQDDEPEYYLCKDPTRHNVGQLLTDLCDADEDFESDSNSYSSDSDFNSPRYIEAFAREKAMNKAWVKPPLLPPRAYQFIMQSRTGLPCSKDLMAKTRPYNSLKKAGPLRATYTPY